MNGHHNTRKTRVCSLPLLRNNNTRLSEIQFLLFNVFSLIGVLLHESDPQIPCRVPHTALRVSFSPYYSAIAHYILCRLQLYGHEVNAECETSYEYLAKIANIYKSYIVIIILKRSTTGNI
jgi:hypothetical protein